MQVKPFLASVIRAPSPLATCTCEHWIYCDHLVHDYFGLHAIEDDGGVVFNLPYGEWIRLFRANGLQVEDLIEPRPAQDATSSYRDSESLAWSRRWPAESIWRLRKGSIA